MSNSNRSPMRMSERSTRSQSSDSSGSRRSSSSLLNLLRLRSAQKKLDREAIILGRRNNDENSLWSDRNLSRLAKLLSNGVVAKMGRVPEEIAVIAKNCYNYDKNSSWTRQVVQDFKDEEIGDLIKMFTGAKTKSVSSACKLLGTITGTGEKNPAYILEKFGLWDKGVGDEMEMPVELDRRALRSNKEEGLEADLAILLFVVGVVVNLLLKMDEQNYEDFFQFERDERSEALARATKDLSALIEKSAQKVQKSQNTTISKVVKSKGKSKEVMQKEFVAPRKQKNARREETYDEISEATLSKKEAMVELSGKEAKVLMETKLAILEAQMAKLLRAQEAMHAALEEKDFQIEELTQKLGAAQGFAKAVVTNTLQLKEKGRTLRKHKRNVDSVSDETASEDRLSDIDTASSTSSEGSDRISKKSDRNGVSRRKRDVLVAQHSATVQISASRRPVDVTYLLDQVDTQKGLLWSDVRGNLYAIRKAKAKESVTGMYKLVLLHANWQDEGSLQYDVSSNSKYFLPQNYMQWRALMNLQITTLENDLQNGSAIKTAKAVGGYDTAKRKECLNSYYLLMKELIRSVLSGEHGSDHPLHVQAWAIFAHFHYLIFTYAMLTNQDELLRSNVLSLWNLHFDAKIKAISFSISIKEAASLLGYGCSKSGCRRIGVLDNYCPGCNREEVRTLLAQEGTEGESSVEGYNQRYKRWKADQLGKGVQDVSKEAFKKSNPAPEKKTVKKSNAVSEEEYYYFLESNQSLFSIQLPSRVYLNL